MNQSIRNTVHNLVYENSMVFILLLTMAPYFFLALFSVPSSDDFGQAFKSIDQGILGFLSSYYMNWSGRYASGLFIATFNVLGHQIDHCFLINFYYIVPIGIIFLCLASSHLFIALISGEFKLRWQIIFALVSTILVFSYIELRSTVYWLSGGAVYTLGNSLFLVSLSITLSLIYIRSIHRNLAVWLALNAGLIFFINGCNEIIMMCNVVIMSGLVILGYLFKSIEKTDYYKLLLLELVAIISTLISVLAPGNAVRTAQDGQQTEILKVMLKSLWEMIDNVFHWINPLWLCFCIVFFLISRYLLSDKLELYIRNTRKFIPLLISLLAALYMSYFVRYYAQGSAGPLRANSTSYVIFFALTCFICLYGYVKYDMHERLRRCTSKHTFIVVILYCFLVANVSFEPILKDIKLLKSHYSYYQAIYPQLISGNPGETIDLPPEPRVSVLRWQCYLTDDPQYWVNEAVAQYFNVGSVVVQKGGAPHYECGGLESYKGNRAE